MKYRDELEKWLKPICNEHKIKIWTDQRILGGGEVRGKINENLEKASIILLLLSQDFLTSNSCEKEMDYALSSIQSKRVIPIILKTCTWKETGCREILALPEDGKAVNDWENPDKAYESIFIGIKKILEDIRTCCKINSDFLEELNKQEFIKQGINKIELNEIFVFPFLTMNKGAFEQKVIKEDFFLSKDEKRVVIRGHDFSGKTTLLKWIFLNYYKNDKYPIFVNGEGVLKTKDFEGHIRKVFEEEYDGDFSEWYKKDDKVIIIDNYHHRISRNFIDFIRSTFRTVLLALSEEEYLVYFKEETDFADYSVISINQFSLSKQEDLIRKWMTLGEPAQNILNGTELELDKMISKVDNVITLNRIVPRYPFYILTILQSLEGFMPQDLSITAYGHCYQALITAQIIKKGVKTEQIDSCINYLRELSLDIHRNKSTMNDYPISRYEQFKSTYKSNFYIPDNVITRLENNEYPIIILKNSRASFSYDYVYYFFLGMAFANLNSIEEIEKLVENIHLKENALSIVFTIHHAQNQEVLDTIQLHCLCLLDDVKVATLSTQETRFMNELVNKLPHDIVSKESVEENRRKENDKKDQIIARSENDEAVDDGNEVSIKINKGLRIIEVFGQILKNRAGSFEKPKVIELIEHTTELGLRLLNLFLQSYQTQDFKIFLSKMLEQAEEENLTLHKNPMSQEKKIEFIERTVQLFGYIVTVGMLNRICYALNSEKLTQPLNDLVSKKSTPAFSMINYLVQTSQNGVDFEHFSGLYKDFDQTKNHWAKRTLSYYVQSYLNVHKVNFKTRQKIYQVLGINKYIPNRQQ
jgi:hypothetical protein